MALADEDDPKSVMTNRVVGDKLIKEEPDLIDDVLLSEIFDEESDGTEKFKADITCSYDNYCERKVEPTMCILNTEKEEDLRFNLILSVAGEEDGDCKREDCSTSEKLIKKEFNEDAVSHSTAAGMYLTSEIVIKEERIDESVPKEAVNEITSVKMLTESPSKAEFKCDSCGKAFPKKAYLRDHLWSHSVEKHFKCSTCDKTFKHRNSLRIHHLAHKGEKPFECATCGKHFLLKIHLKKHCLAHSGEKHHKCDVCGKPFTHKNSLDRHMFTHSAEKPFKCDQCEKQFVQRSDLQLHLAKHARPKEFKCYLCSKRFTVKELLTQHMLDHIGSDTDESTADSNYVASDASELENTLHAVTDDNQNYFTNEPEEIFGESSFPDVVVSDERSSRPEREGDSEQFKRDGEVEQPSRSNYTDRRTFCLFCKKDVTHFARHLFTRHESEPDTRRAAALPANSKERKIFLGQLRNQGNFIRNKTASKIRPARRIKTSDTETSGNFLPCSYCLGFYKKQSLYRHTRTCSLNKTDGKTRQHAQIDGQTTLLLHSPVKYDELLREELFPRMRADSINFAAQKDSLICRYAYCYLKVGKSKGRLDVVRQNVRRLAKLLLFSKERHGDEIKELFDVLRPRYFQTIVEAVRVISKYNQETENYRSITAAACMNFCSLIKKCCDVAHIHLIQLRTHTALQREELLTLKSLLESQWGDEVARISNKNPCKYVGESDPGPSSSTDLHIEEVPSKTAARPRKQQKASVRRCTRKWLRGQVEVLVKHFAKHIEEKRAPKKLDVLEVQALYPDLFKDREWRNIKAYIYNVYSKNLKSFE